MTKFVYINNDYRNAWWTYIRNEHGQFDSNYDKNFLEEFEFKLDEEKHFLTKYSRPYSWFLNDQLSENEFVFNMSQEHAPKVKYEYTNNLPSLKDILLERALEISKKGKEIQLFYSGGIDSVAVLLAFYEVCPKDQLHIIMGGGELVINNYPKIFEEVIKNLNYEFTDNLFGIADPSKYIFTTGSESDRLFGADGFTLIMGRAKRDPDSKYGYVSNVSDTPNTDDPKNDEWNWERWWGITRHTYLTQSFRLLQNISCDKMDMENYQPLFFDKRVQQFSINLHINKEFKWYNSGRGADLKRYQEGKIWVRDFIYDMYGDKDYAYHGGKTLNYYHQIQYHYKKPFPPQFNVLAITEDGTIVNRDNVMNYLTGKELTI